MKVIKIPVTLSAPPIAQVTMKYATSDGSAKAGKDYIAINGTLVFPPGATSRELEVQVASPVDASQDLNFILTLSDVRGALPDYGAQISIRLRTTDSSLVFSLDPESVEVNSTEFWVVCTSNSPNKPIFGELGSCVSNGVPFNITLDTAAFELLEQING